MIATAILLGVLTVTSYQAVPAQTKPTCISRSHCTTSINDGITMFGIAISQDLLKSGAVHYGDILYVDGYGYRVVNDCMNVRHMRAVDLLVFTRSEEKQIGVRHRKVFVLQNLEALPGVKELQ